MVVTKTLGPLHFEDLEPHHFEDLVRELVYDFKIGKASRQPDKAGRMRASISAPMSVQPRPTVNPRRDPKRTTTAPIPWRGICGCSNASARAKSAPPRLPKS
jgi:hypothetical protein